MGSNQAQMSSLNGAMGNEVKNIYQSLSGRSQSNGKIS